MPSESDTKQTNLCDDCSSDILSKRLERAQRHVEDLVGTAEYGYDADKIGDESWRLAVEDIPDFCPHLPKGSLGGSVELHIVGEPS